MVLPSEEQYRAIKVKSVSGRYVTNSDIKAFLDRPGIKYDAAIPGTSVQERPIYAINLGSGKIKVMMWSQMHGNESTTTKAVLDLLDYLNVGGGPANEILVNCTIKIFPVLNPDGASQYTRVNANGIDLNRDARELSQPESILLRKMYEEFQPDYCFNLHDQRSIFNVGNTPKPATISFLAPAMDEERTISEARRRSMQLIATMEKGLRNFIPGQMARYDDAFNPNCVGDSFQMLGTPTVLFEAGHYPKDYQREQTRQYIFTSLVIALKAIATGDLKGIEEEGYFSIPENNKLFFDVKIKNAHQLNPRLGRDEDVGILYREVLEQGSILFDPYIETTGNLTAHFGHTVYDCTITGDLQKLKKDTLVYALLI